ncbi:DNA polymerase IV [Pseudoalteromonas luteoviolacea]|uniref:DNA polymerase IV n=1 Tax=Pseudoalteromonas luteoviolacea (strain 2ta16) TaxID=1353533 RepID=V4I176_PSEL2|nr:DNA polymerase IV [Pseudoalteromonas luteoviolacea]ESP93999.1 nucleotidyltransferase/DNA polymerase [Pseudoalteromonas luteoviolacea 2ta16]KZN33511.1 DNA polymerase IV [Pseudoalteromonas luteoviolacea NCIMB 1944]
MRKFIHIDMDCFYAAVEMRDNPALAKVPMAIGGNSHRGVLSTANYIAREFGVRSAMSNYKAKQLCPQLVIVPGRMQVYKEVSQQIRQIFSRYTHLIEPLSLDEAYLDVTDCEVCQGSATLIAQQIRTDIYNETGLTASAGVAPIKFLAKIASDENKPNGQCVITPTQVDDFIDELPLRKIPGVGKVTHEKLLACGLVTGRDIKALSQDEMATRFGKFGRVLWRRCQGVDDRGVETERVRKSVGVETTFEKDIKDLAQLKSILCDKLIPELTRRSARYQAEREFTKLGVKVKFYDFSQTTKECQCHHIDKDILCTLLEQAVARYGNKPVRLVGVQIGLGDAPSNQVQMGLFN